MNGILVLLSTVTLVSGLALQTVPQNNIVQAGHDARFNCTPDGSLGDVNLIWKELISNKLGATIYSTDMDGPNDPADYQIVNNYDLVVLKTDWVDGGWYTCELTGGDPSPARLIVIEPPVFIQNLVDFVEGNVYNMGCSVRFGSPVFETEEENLPVFSINIDNRIVAEHKLTQTTGEAGVTPWSYSAGFNFTALPELHGKEVDCVVETELPEFRIVTSQTLHIYHGVNSVNIVNKEDKYREGETIVCSANGYPAPTYTWMCENTGKEIGGDKLRVTSDMVGANNKWKCMANNTVAGMEAQVSESISFRAEERSVSGAASAVWSLNAVLCMVVTVMLGYAC